MRLVDQFGLDRLQGLGMGRDANQPEETAVLYASTSVHPSVDEADSLTLVIDNHHTPGAQVAIHVYFAEGY